MTQHVCMSEACLGTSSELPEDRHWLCPICTDEVRWALVKGEGMQAPGEG